MVRVVGSLLALVVLPSAPSAAQEDVSRPPGLTVVPLASPPGTVHCVAFSPDGAMVAAGGWDRAVTLWDLQQVEPARTLGPHSAPVYALAFRPDGGMLAAADGPNVALWNPHTGELLGTLAGHQGTVRSVAFTWDGAMLASGSDDQTVILWDIPHGKPLRTLAKHTGAVRCVAFDAWGGLVASASEDHTAIVWDVRSGAAFWPPPTHNDIVSSVGLGWNRLQSCPTLASAGFDGAVVLSDAWSFMPIHRLEGHKAPVNCVAFSPDWDVLASGGSDNAVLLWHMDDVEIGQGPQSLPGPGTLIEAIAFSPNALALASAGRPGTIGIWDPARGELLATLWSIGERGPRNLPQPTGQWAAWTPDGYYHCSPGAEQYLRFRDEAGVVRSPGGYPDTLRHPARVRRRLLLSLWGEFPITTYRGQSSYGAAVHGDTVVWAEEHKGKCHLYARRLTTDAKSRIASGPMLEPAVYGDIVVWQDRRRYTRDNPDSDIYGYDLSTGREFPICRNPQAQSQPAIYARTVIWQDDRSGNPDIYGCNLESGDEFPICTDPSAQRDPVIWGDTVVWVDNRNGNLDIYGYDLRRGYELLICAAAGDQDSPAIYGSTVVWRDGRNIAPSTGRPDDRGVATVNWDIYGCDLTRETESPICTAPSSQCHPAIHGDIVVWADARATHLLHSQDIYGYDLRMGWEFTICTRRSFQAFPAIWGNTVVWQDCRNSEGRPEAYGARLPYPLPVP